MKEKIESQSSCLTKQDESIRNAFVAFVLQDMPHKLNIATNGYDELLFYLHKEAASQQIVYHNQIIWVIIQ